MPKETETIIIKSVTDNKVDDYQVKILSRVGVCYYITLKHVNIGDEFISELEFSTYSDAWTTYKSIVGFNLEKGLISIGVKNA